MMLIHPGEELRDYLDAENIKTAEFAGISGITQSVINQIVACKMNITPLIAHKLEAATSIGAETWLGLQMKYDLKFAMIDEGRK